MRKHSCFVRSLCIFVAIWSAISSVDAQPPGQQPPYDQRAVVSASKIVFSFPRPYNLVEAPNPPLLGYYAWRVSIETTPALSFVLSTPTPLRTQDHDAIVRASSLRLCPSSTSTIAECTKPIEGEGHVNAQSIKLELKDASLIALIRKARPEAYWRTVIEPGGRYAVDQLFFRY
jgi:hypothetical protein